jgi:hypothetical protein
MLETLAMFSNVQPQIQPHLRGVNPGSETIFVCTLSKLLIEPHSTSQIGVAREEFGFTLRCSMLADLT